MENATTPPLFSIDRQEMEYYEHVGLVPIDKVVIQ